MDIIKNNPYRILGLLVGISAREKDRQIRRLKQYIEAEHEPENDFCFPILGKIHREIGNIEAAESALNLDSDRMHAAIFWFYQGNEVTDEPAFELLREGDESKTISIWSKLTQTGEITAGNCSAFQNLSTLLLNKAFSSEPINTTLLEQAIILKLKFLESEFIKEFKSLAADETYETNKKNLQLYFLNQILSDGLSTGSITLPKFIEIIFNKKFLAKEEFIDSIAQKIIIDIEQTIEKSRKARQENNAIGYKIGSTLFKNNSNKLSFIKAALGQDNIKYTSISDKFAEEVLQCGIDYFNHFRETNTDPGKATLELFEKARSIAKGNICLQRCEENRKNVQEWVDEKPEREIFEKIKMELTELASISEKFEKRYSSVENAHLLLSEVLPLINQIRMKVGNSTQLYFNISTRFAAMAQSMLIDEINKIQAKFTDYLPNNTKLELIYKLRYCANKAWAVTETIERMDLLPEFRTSFNNNRSSLLSIKNSVSVNNSSSSNSGCYIATMVYGNYDHPKVIILRQFRDNVLEKSWFGRSFVQIYYKISPRLVEMLKDKKTVNNIIRNLLNNFIKYIQI